MKISKDILKELVKDSTFHVVKYIENDNSVTLSMNEFDLVINAKDADEAITVLIEELREYTMEYWEDIELWSSDINRKKQIKSIIKVIVTEDDAELRESFVLKD